MDSNVSADGDYENESPKNRAWMSSNSDDNHSSSDHESPVKNSDRASSSPERQHLSTAKVTSNSDRESSPEAKSDVDISDREEEEDDDGGGDNDNDNDDDDDDDDDDDEEEEEEEDDDDDDDEDGEEENIVDSNRNQRLSAVENTDQQRKLSVEPNDERNDYYKSECEDENSSSIVGSPRVMENDSLSDGVCENRSSPKNASAPASPRSQRDTEDKVDDADEGDDDRDRNHDQDNDHDNDDNNNSSDRSRRDSGNELDDANTPYESVNGDLSPKSVKRSNSVGWDSRSEIASSLDSVSPSQFERQHSSSKFQFQDDENCTADQKERNLDSKKAIIDFADDLSDVSDIESNDSYVEQREENVDQPDRKETNALQEAAVDHRKSPPIQREREREREREEQQQHRYAHQSHHNHNQRRPHIVDAANTNNHNKCVVDDGAVSLHVEGEEQLDFEAEEGECSPKLDRIKEVEDETKKDDEREKDKEQEKEKEDSDLEEGELTDDNDAKPEETERPVCRFFSRGHCTWGSNCRFIHPGVMDKGNYSMFETVRPIITAGGPPPPNSNASIMYPVFPSHLTHSHLPVERPGSMTPGSGGGNISGGGNVPIPRKDEPALESSWERGLRQAKEMIRKSSKRKETEVDFEDKKMNLTLSQDEIDKENDYYSRNSASPGKSPDVADKWKLDGDVKSHRIAAGDSYGSDVPPAIPHASSDVPPLGYYPPLHHGLSRPAAVADYWGAAAAAHRMGGLPYDEYALRAPPIPYGAEYYAAAAAAAGRRYMHPNSYYPPRPGNVPAPQSHHAADFYDRKQKHKPYPSSSREVIVQKNDKAYKDDSPSRYRNRREDSPRMERARDDEWADPWMRTKSPASGRARRRKDTYSSASSYSSSSESSRSSSRSSFSSKSRQSRSRSKARSSGSHSSSRSASESQPRKKAPMQFKLSPSSRTQLPTTKKAIKSISPTLLLERRAATERAMHMNPPPPSPKIKTRPHSPPAVHLGGGGGVAAAANSSLPSSATSPRAKSGLPDRLLPHTKAAVAAMRPNSNRSSESRSSKSSSGSSSSDSSSDSSDSSASSSSTSKSDKTPPVRAQKRNIPANDHSASSQTVKNKAMDALKLSGQKQRIKLTLKGSGNSGNATQSKRVVASDTSDPRKEKPVSASKKRMARSSDSDSDSDRASSAKKGGKPNQKKGAPSRREELLKQLKAVEDAIARKKSKIS